MLMPMSRLHHEEAHLEEDRWHHVETKMTKNTVSWMSVVLYKARQGGGWHGMETKRTKNSLKRINRLSHTRRDEEGRHGYHNARREDKYGHGYHKARPEEEDRHWYHNNARREDKYGHGSHKSQREEKDWHGYHNARREDKNGYGYHKARREEEDRHQHGYHNARREDKYGHRYHKARREDKDRHRHGYHNACREDEYGHGYHKARQEEEDRHCHGYHKAHQEDEYGKARREDEDRHRHGYHNARREAKSGHGYHKARREDEDRHRHGYHKARREDKYGHGYHKARREDEDRHGYHKARREKEDPHDFQEKKTKTISKPMNSLHQKAQLEEEKYHGLETKKSKNAPWLTNAVHYKAHHENNKLQSTYNQQKPQDDTVALVALLKACAKEKDLHQGSILHTDIMTRGLLENNVFIGSALVNMYAKCGAIEKAQEVFDKLPVHNVVSWTTLIAGYAQHGQVQEALSRFELMQLKGFSPDAFTFACILRACTSVEAFDKGKVIHSLMVRDYPLIEENVHVGSVLVDMYSKCGALEKAQEAFDKLPVQDVVSWTALIAGYAQHEQGEEALINFEQMQHEGFFPDAVTFSCVLKACGSTQAARKGQNIHAQIVRHGLLENNMFIGTALVDMYINCGMLAEAQDSFDKLRVRDVVCWSALIGGYAQLGHGDEALKCFEQMQHDGFTPDVVTLTYVLKACGSMGASNKAQEIYAHIVRERTLDIHIGTVLVDMYAKCGALDKAKEVFGKLEVRDVVLWTALIAGYTHHGHEEEALGSFEQMLSEGFYPDAVTFASILKACGNVGAVHKGQKLHAEIARHGLPEDGKNVGTALVDMYANLGMLGEAQELFDKLAVQDMVSWSVLIAGYAQLGQDKFVFTLFDKMIQEGKQPDPVTFIAVLNTCSHKGLVDKGQLYFELISKDFGMLPILEHHTCIIDLFGRAGHLDKALAVIEDMSLSANLTLWHTFLGACQKWGNTKLGSWAFEHAVQLSETNAAPYVSIRNIYSDAVGIDNKGKYGDQKSKYTWT